MIMYTLAPPTILVELSDFNWKMSQDKNTYSEIMIDNSTKQPGGAMSQDSASSVMTLYQVAIPSLFALIVLLGILGNLLVIYVILSRKRLRTSTNLLLLNLAVSDVSFLLVCGSFTVVHYALREWPFGDIFCRTIQYLLYVTCYVTVYTLTAVSVVRYLSVVHSRTSKRILSLKNVVLLIVTLWVVFLIAKIPILLVHGVSTEGPKNSTICIISGKKEAQQLFASFFVFAYALPLVVICTLYIGILCHLKKNHAEAIHHSPGAEERQRHVTKVVILVVATFAVCWLPLHVHLLIAYYGELPDSFIYKVLLIVWHCLSYANSLFNPIIYNVFSKDFRQSFKEVVCCKRRASDRSQSDF